MRQCGLQGPARRRRAQVPAGRVADVPGGRGVPGARHRRRGARGHRRAGVPAPPDAAAPRADRAVLRPRAARVCARQAREQGPERGDARAHRRRRLPPHVQPRRVCRVQRAGQRHRAGARRERPERACGARRGRVPARHGDPALRERRRGWSRVVCGRRGAGAAAALARHQPALPRPRRAPEPAVAKGAARRAHRREAGPRPRGAPCVDAPRRDPDDGGARREACAAPPAARCAADRRCAVHRALLQLPARHRGRGEPEAGCARGAVWRARHVGVGLADARGAGGRAACVRAYALPLRAARGRAGDAAQAAGAARAVHGHGHSAACAGVPVYEGRCAHHACGRAQEAGRQEEDARAGAAAAVDDLCAGRRAERRAARQDVDAQERAGRGGVRGGAPCVCARRPRARHGAAARGHRLPRAGVRSCAPRDGALLRVVCLARAPLCYGGCA